MKKHIIYALTALASLSLAGCTGDYTDWSSPQDFTEGGVAEKYGVVFAPGSEANTVMPDIDGMINLVAISATNEAVNDFTIKSVTVNGEEIAAELINNEVTVQAKDLAKIVEKQFDSRAAIARDLTVATTVALNLENGDAVAVDVPGETKATFTTNPLPEIDANGYFLLGDFEGNSWSLETPIVMEAQGDGIFTATVITKNAGDNWFKFYKGSCLSSDWDVVNQGVMGVEVNGDGARHNHIAYVDDPLYTSVETPVINGEGTYEVTLDAANYTFTVRPAEAKYFFVGTVNTPNTWNADLTNQSMFYGLGNNTYSFTAYFTGAWDGKIMRRDLMGLGDDSWSAAWGSVVDGSKDATGELVNTNGQAFSPAEAGFYTLTIDMNSSTYSWTAVEGEPASYEMIGLVGDFNKWGGDDSSPTDVLMTATDATNSHNWYVRYTFTEQAQFKFRANQTWSKDWGAVSEDLLGDAYYMAVGTKNINVAAGTYDIYLNDITGNFNIVKVEE